MKYKFCALILFIFYSCHSQEPKITIIEGNLGDLKLKTIYLVPVEQFFPSYELINKDYPTTTIDSVGNFSFKIKNFNSGFYQIISENFSQLKYDLYVECGDSLSIIKPFWKTNDHFQITGKGSNKLKYLVVDNQKYPLKSLVYDTIKTNGFKSELSFKNYLDSIYNHRLETLYENDSTPNHLKEYFKSSLLFEKSTILLSHLERRNYIMNSSFEYFIPNESYYTFESELLKLDSNTMNLQLKTLANVLLNHKSRTDYKAESELDWFEKKAIWKMSYLQNLTNSTWKDIMILASTLDYPMELNSKDFFDSLIVSREIFQSSFTSEKLKHLYNARVESFLELAPGELAPNFELPDKNGNSHKLSDYLGNIVYINFWGTWCYPCIEQIPKALELQNHFKGKPVVFIYISLESNDENVLNWKNFIEGKDELFGKFLDYKPFPGIHLVAKEQMRNPEIAPYKINFAPTYVLIDQTGLIANPRANRPDKIKDDINELLIQ